MNASQPLAFVNARLVDPESGSDGPGGVIVSEGVITDVAKGREFGKLSKAVRVIDCSGALLAPGLIDLRVRTGEPGAETKETLDSAAKAAAAGGVTSFVVQPDTAPAILEQSPSKLRRRAAFGRVREPQPAAAAPLGGLAAETAAAAADGAQRRSRQLERRSSFARRASL